MECDAIVKNRNKTPLIYNHLLFKEGDQEQFLRELSDLYNKFGVDSMLNIRDFLLAEMTFNFLAVINNTIDKEFEMKVCNEPETIKISIVIQKTTISQVLKWLRDEFSFHLSTKPYLCEDGLRWMYEVRKFKQHIIFVVANKKGFTEEKLASFAGIEYVLNLI